MCCVLLVLLLLRTEACEIATGTARHRGEPGDGPERMLFSATCYLLGLSPAIYKTHAFLRKAYYTTAPYP